MSGPMGFEECLQGLQQADARSGRGTPGGKDAVTGNLQLESTNLRQDKHPI